MNKEIKKIEKEQIIVEHHISQSGNKYAVLYLNNPSAKNSMTVPMAASFKEAIEEIKTDKEISALVITGMGDIFSSGGDFTMLESFQHNSKAENKKHMISFYSSFLSVFNLDIPVVAAVNGHAVGAALALVLACDIQVLAKNSKHAFNFVKIAIHPGMGSSFLAPRTFGMQRGSELLISGRYFSSEDAFNWGLGQKLIAKDSVLDESISIVEELLKNGLAATNMLKLGLRKAERKKLWEVLEYESNSQADNYSSRDFSEAIKAIREKRKPVYSNR